MHYDKDPWRWRFSEHRHNSIISNCGLQKFIGNWRFVSKEKYLITLFMCIFMFLAELANINLNAHSTGNTHLILLSWRVSDAMT